MILPCGVSKAPNRPRPGSQQRHVGGDEAVEKVAGVLAADLDHAPVGKKRCFHVGKVLFEPGKCRLSDITRQRKTLRCPEQGPRAGQWPYPNEATDTRTDEAAI